MRELRNATLSQSRSTWPAGRARARERTVTEESAHGARVFTKRYWQPANAAAYPLIGEFRSTREWPIVFRRRTAAIVWE